MPIARRVILPFLLLGALFAAPAGHAAFGPVGSLNQLGDTRGCLATGDSACTTGRAMGGIGRLGTNADRSVILAPAAGTDSVAVLFRDAQTGVLNQSSSTAGCVAPPGNALSCKPAKNLDGAVDAAFSPDGKHAYVAGANGVSVFEFVPDPTVGGLSPIECHSNTDVAQPGNEDNQCVNGRALSGLTAIAVSPDGTLVFATTDSSNDDRDGVVILKRDAATGKLTQEDSPGGCVTKAKTADGDGDLPTSGSTPKNCGGELRAIENPRDLVLSRDGSTLYVATSRGVAVLKRSGTTLTQSTGVSGCSTSGPDANCSDERALGEPWSLALSGDGADLYVSNSGVREVAHFAVAFDGTLTQPKDETGCVADPATPGDGPQPCATARGLTGGQPGIGVSPDGGTVAVGGSNAIGEVVLLDRGPTGGLSQAADTRGCVSQSGAATGTGGGAGKCLQANGVAGSDFAWSTGSHHFYAAGGQSVAFLRREVAPSCDDPSAATDSMTPVTVQFSCSDLNGDVVALEIAGAPAKGSAGTPDAERRVVYTPQASASGIDTFLVRPKDQSGNGGRLSTATVNVTFKAPPPPPPPPPVVSGKVPLPRAITKVLRQDFKRRIRFSLDCPEDAIVNCKGRLELSTTKKLKLRKSAKKRRVFIYGVNYDLKPGQRKRFIFKANRNTRRVVRLFRKTSVTVTLKAPKQPAPAGFTGELAAARNNGLADLKR